MDKLSGSIARSLVSSLIRVSLAAFCCVGIVSCKSSDSTVTPNGNTNGTGLIIPAGFPMVQTPADNPYSDSKSILGRYLFYEKKLSADNTKACVDCHKQANAFCDFGNPVSIGISVIGRGRDSGGFGSRNAPGLTNVAYNAAYFWDGRASSLEQQALLPITNPIELGNTLPVVVQRLSADVKYQDLFKAAFGDSKVDSIRIGMALATFERTLLSGNSAFDAYNRGDPSALSASAIRGLALFNSAQTNCSRCHSGFNFEDSSFHSTGLEKSYSDSGRFLITKQQGQVGSFKTPSLRNVALTSPYEHDGRFSTLEQVMDHYNQGGQHNSDQDSLIKPLNLSNKQIEDIIAFLNSLTDEQFVANAAFKDPH
jgi:cytochrome c peroxidase